MNSTGRSFRYANVGTNPGPWKLADANNRLWIMEMCSKPRRYLFIHLICYSCSDLLIAASSVCAGFVYCCCPLAVCLDQLWLILPGVVWTLQMSVYNLLIPFISGCCCRRMCLRACVFCVCEGVFVQDRWGWVAVSMCWKWVDLIYAVLPSNRGGREGGVRQGETLGCVFVASRFSPLLSLSFFIFSHALTLSLSISVSFVFTSSSASSLYVAPFFHQSLWLFRYRITHSPCSIFGHFFFFCPNQFYGRSLRLPFILSSNQIIQTIPFPIKKKVGIPKLYSLYLLSLYVTVTNQKHWNILFIYFLNF